MTVGDHPAGAPCWLELGGPADRAVMDHYATLLGWRFDVNDHVAGYVRGFVSGHKVAGFGGPAHPRPARGWRVYTATDDLDHAVERWTLAGGRADAAVTMADGRFAWLTDPWGTATGVFESDVDPGTSAASGVGLVSGWTLFASDTTAALDFYERALGPGFVREVAVEQAQGGQAAGWLVSITVAADGPLGDVVDPKGGILRLVRD